MATAQFCPAVMIPTPAVLKGANKLVHINNELLISEVSKRPALWQPRMKKYRNSGMRAVLWMEVTRIILPLHENAGTFFVFIPFFF